MKIRSAIAFVMPMTLTGLHALSVLMPTTVSTGSRPSLIARTTLTAPTQLVRTACSGKYSQTGTCFSAAALKTMSASRIAEHTSA